MLQWIWKYSGGKENGVINTKNSFYEDFAKKKLENGEFFKDLVMRPKVSEVS